MNYRHQWGSTEETTRARRSQRRQASAPALTTCPVCGGGVHADALATGHCVTCQQRHFPAVKAEMPTATPDERRAEVRRRVLADLAA